MFLSWWHCPFKNRLFQLLWLVSRFFHEANPPNPPCSAPLLCLLGKSARCWQQSRTWFLAVGRGAESNTIYINLFKYDHSLWPTVHQGICRPAGRKQRKTRATGQTLRKPAYSKPSASFKGTVSRDIVYFTLNSSVNLYFLMRPLMVFYLNFAKLP